MGWLGEDLTLSKGVGVREGCSKGKVWHCWRWTSQILVVNKMGRYWVKCPVLGWVAAKFARLQGRVVTEVWNYAGPLTEYQSLPLLKLGEGSVSGEPNRVLGLGWGGALNNWSAKVSRGVMSGRPSPTCVWEVSAKMSLLPFSDMGPWITVHSAVLSVFLPTQECL